MRTAQFFQWRGYTKFMTTLEMESMKNRTDVNSTWWRPQRKVAQEIVACFKP